MSIERQNMGFSLPIARGFIMDENNADLIAIRQPSINPLQETLEKREIDVICKRYADDTWSGLARMSQTPTGYPEDMITVVAGKETSNSKTSPTNIGLFLASTIAARDMHLVSSEEADRSIGTVLTSLENAEKYEGMFYNWYDTQTGDIAGKSDRPFISAVDNAWLTAGLMTIRAATSPEYSERAEKIIKQMKFPLLYNRDRNLFYGGYYPDTEEPTNWHYDILNTEARIASYVWAGTGEDIIPLINYNRLGKFAPADVDAPRQNAEQFLSWGGSMFEALMPTLFVPEQEWSPAWKSSHREYLKKQIEYGKKYNNGFWGMSSYDYNGTYHEAGLSGLAIKQGGYGASDIVTPHASFLGLSVDPEQAIMNLQKIERLHKTSYKEGFGFPDSVNIESGEVSNSYLAVDQEMSMLAVFNYLYDNRIHDYISPQLVAIRPLFAYLDNSLPMAA